MRTSKYRIGSLSSSEPRKTEFMIEHRLLPIAWYKDMREKTNILWQLQNLDLSWRCCHENHRALQQYVESHKKVLSISSEIHLLTDEVQDAFVKLSQLITNSLVSYTVCLNMCEQYMEKVYTKDNEAFQLWNNFRKELHKDTFEYKFGYVLRNYTQHYGLPVSEIYISTDSVSLTDIQVFALTEKLFNGSFKWPSDLESVLQALDSGKVDINLVLIEYLKCVDKVYAGVLRSHIEELSACDMYLSNLCREFKIKSCEYPVVFKGDILQGDEVPKEKEFIPVYILKRMKEIWVEKLSFNITKH
ncbi:hypothetical protein [Photobacterium kishitanii]|uniref:hypothetical protein n=1 Tax=Photobacterium kishitanii TaxID=318456 RepID=UPI0005ADEB2A|nr:hypothetical protein [Photobacterium kishitanii]CEO41984.1 hypothetical protein PPBDW_II1315 [Photobacterium kishitanii]